MNGKIITHFIYRIEPRAYCYKVYGDEKEHKKSKGVVKHKVSNQLSYKTNEETLNRNCKEEVCFNTIRSKNHQIYSINQTKFKGLRLTAGRRPTWVCGASVTPMLALVGLRLSKVKLSGAHLSPRLGQVGPMWSMLGTSWAHVEPMLGLCSPMLGLCWPRLGLRWAYVGVCWPHVGPVLAYVGPMLNHLGGYVGYMLGYVGYLRPMLGIC